MILPAVNQPAMNLHVKDASVSGTVSSTGLAGPVDVAVVLPTVLRPTLTRAVESVYAQDFSGRIQLLVGIDVVRGDPGQLEALRARCPSHIDMTVFDLGYSTSVRHGGPHACAFGGALRTILSFAARARIVAYLDDDDWYAPDHLSSLRTALDDKAWAYSLSWYVNPWNDEPMCVDRFESAGPGAGVYAAKLGGFVRGPCLMLDKLRCQPLLHCWSQAMFASGDGEDRLVFAALKQAFPEFGTSDVATVYCPIKPDDEMHERRLAYIAGQGYDVTRLQNATPPPLARI